MDGIFTTSFGVKQLIHKKHLAFSRVHNFGFFFNLLDMHRTAHLRVFKTRRALAQGLQGSSLCGHRATPPQSPEYLITMNTWLLLGCKSAFNIHAQQFWRWFAMPGMGWNEYM